MVEWLKQFIHFKHMVNYNTINYRMSFDIIIFLFNCKKPDIEKKYVLHEHFVYITNNMYLQYRDKQI